MTNQCAITVRVAWAVFALCFAPVASGYCEMQDVPRTVRLTTRVVEIQDDAAYRAGRDVWVHAGTQADAQVHLWLVWSHWPTGRNCVVRFVGRENDLCGYRIDVQFQQRTPYNLVMTVSDSPSASPRYPLRCSLEARFHVQDITPIPNPDPSQLPYVDPGFYYSTVIELEVTGTRYANPGGVASVPPGVNRNGCPVAQPGDEFPPYMLEGPGCPGR